MPKRIVKPPPPRGSKKTNKKTFSIKQWEGSKEGEKIIIYADSGMGKTTLSAMAPTPVFIALDDGSRKVTHPLTGEELFHVPGVGTFDDVRFALQQTDLFDEAETVVIDTATVMEDLALQWTLDNVPHEKGHLVNRIEGYGYGKGYRHLYDTMKLPLADMDRIVRQGKNVIVICQLNQVEIANAGGEDFLKEIPKLQPSHGKGTPSVWGAYVEWADHVFKIGYESVSATDGKAIAGNNRAVFVHPEIYFAAKSRGPKLRDYPVVSFNTPEDDSLWNFLFPERHGE